MLTLLIGKKGSGKTKKLIDLASKALEATKGNVVVIEKGAKLTYDVSHEARLIDTDAYDISGKDAILGFISGICAANYDVTDILVDSTLKIIGKNVDDLKVLVEKLEVLCKNANTNIVLSVSLAKEELPETMLNLVSE